MEKESPLKSNKETIWHGAQALPSGSFQSQCGSKRKGASWWMRVLWILWG